MRIRSYITQFIALGLAILTLNATAPVSIAEVASTANIGSVSAVGNVQLRGVGISEGTLFSGDRLSVSPGAYAKVVLSAGAKMELDGSSDVTVSKNGDGIAINMKAGNIAFTGADKPVHVQVGEYEITAVKNARATVAYVGSTSFGIRVMEGSVAVRNSATKQSFTVQKGTEQLVSLSGSQQTGTVRLASSGIPSSIPAPPTMPRAQSSSGLKTALLVATVVGSAGAIAVLMTKNNDSDANAAARLRLATASQTLSVVANTAAQATTVVTQVDTAATAANNAINNAPTSPTFTAAEKAALVARAGTLTSAAQASKNAIANLNLQLANLQNSLGNADASTAASIESQIATILANTNAEVAKLNQYISDLNKLVQDANAEVPNLIPAPAIQPVAPAAPASGSNPA
jgi:hypothetical protein